MQFRHDINGLRAIAVLAVMIFHFNPHWLPGGFAGVDIFFVISGFLMTSIIFSQIQNGSFSLFSFYNARINRIVPVLAVCCIILLSFGWFYLLPNDYQLLGKQVEKSILFISNILFSKGYGYFDSSEHTKWLLHTWSLSIEWQFYIFFPLIILMIKKIIKLNNIKYIIFFLFIVSFLYSIYSTYQDSKSAYFLLSSRAWEMLFGSLAFLHPLRLKKGNFVLHILGLILIFTAYFLISKSTPWPGYMALVPVLGAYFVIASQCNTIFINNFIFNPIGKWSYSIYIWHWPLVVFGFYFSLNSWWIYGIPLSIIFGFISYQFIERIKFQKYASWRNLYKVIPLYLLLVTLTLGYAIKETNGFKSHYSEAVLKILSETKNSFPYSCKTGLKNGEIDVCKIGKSEKINAIIVGDSHAKAITSAVIESLDSHQNTILSITTAGCPYIPNANFDNNYCKATNEKKKQFLAKSEGIPIILVNRYLQRLEGENNDERISNENEIPIYFSNMHASKHEIYAEFHQNLQATICELTKKSPVYIVNSIPEFPFDVPKHMGKQLLINRQLQKNSISLQSYEQRAYVLNRILAQVAQTCGAHLLDVSQTLCKNSECISQINNRPIYKDGDHLSEYGNKLLIPMFKSYLQQK
ncbi:acyltransferase family protein [Acinetobacter sp. HY1485]|uniref:acyltransferase family protein n=1 Tax=Acinetobacter sp. HY1485 TaxID=2970918 RepID=UPI0022B96D79|nr:acyltransferase family protein [Acinetobacter sp. HY1485]